MYAIIRAGGKNFKVSAGDTVRVDKLAKDLGEKFDMTDILMVGGDKTVVGQPLVKNAKVSVVVTRQAKAPKIIVFKKKRRQGYRRMQGHRQLFTELFIESITLEGQTFKTDKTAVVVDAVKNQERKAAHAAKQEASGVKKVAKAKAAPKKKVAKKKAGAKKAAGKKTAKAGAKKTAKKASKKA